MTVLRLFAKGITTINKWLFIACTTLVFIMVAFISLEVFSRYALNSPTVWAMELSTMLFGPYFMLAGAYLLHMQGHVNVDIVSARFSSDVQRLSQVVIYLMIAVLCAIFVWQSLPLAVEAFRYGETSFTSWNPVVWPIKMVIPISLALVFMQALAEVFYLFDQKEEVSQ